MLFEYNQQVRRFLRDPRMMHLDEPDITSYVNRARREVALRSQSIRRVPPIAGSVLTIEVTNPGSGYTNPSVVITPPDSPNGALPYPGGAQATAVAQQVTGMISNVSVDFGGSGYFQPVATITDPTGSGVELICHTSPISITQQFQEQYAFADFPTTEFPGVGNAFAVLDVSIIYSNYRYSLPRYPFSVYQSMIRQYPRSYYYVPTMCCTQAAGAADILFMYPVASQQYQFEVDCLCLPTDLDDDDSPEALPSPWTDAVPWLAASYCYAELQNANMAKYYQDQYDNYCHRYTAYARPGYTMNPYGRY